jgi:hypothetical protein
MSKTFELWDTATRNLIGAYASEAEALCLVRQYLSQGASEEVEAWVLLWDDDLADDGGEVASGAALVARAEAEARGAARPPAAGHPL